ncbi:MAG: GvpL/GvpF family gas vesicle protein [Chloroflexi bacterium]|nr:GvpL/GvpF family gas vesicle protein [Chloroflexota bacterium]
MSHGLYVYCIIGTSEARNFGLGGIGGQRDPVTTIAYRDLSAVVSPVSTDRYTVGREPMLAHERVIERVMADYTVLPVRFYTVAPNAEEVRSLLRSRYAEFQFLLRDLDNKVEMGLKALWKNMEQVLREALEMTSALSPHPETGDRREAAARTRLALASKRAEMGDLLLGPLRPLAMDTRLNKTYGDDMIVNAAFLVDRGREREFDARVDRLATAYAESIVFKYVGPAPPYSFVSIVIKDDVPASQDPGKGG